MSATCSASPPAAGTRRIPAAERLAWSRDKQALRALLIAVGDADGSVSAAARAGLLRSYGTPWPTRRVGTSYHAFRGDADKTFEWLDRAYEKHDPGVMAIIDNPFTRELRSDPRFGAFCKKVGLPPPP